MPCRRQRILRRHDHLGFKGNLNETRFGWLRLTPAYSVHLVRELLDRAGTVRRVLDPFCGTGTTSLVCAERGVDCDTTDINPFLLWLTATKTRSFSGAELDRFDDVAARVRRDVTAPRDGAWIPPLHRIGKWWDEPTLSALARTMRAIEAAELPDRVRDLLKVAFCRAMIERANVSFGHQSMSFRKTDGLPPRGGASEVASAFGRAADSIRRAAQSPLRSTPRAISCDARNLGAALRPATYDCVITSPPYPNRMSYIRELRPYMYWLRFLETGRAAGELDWKAIGGTWGCATSNVGRWRPERPLRVAFDGFDGIVRRIAVRSELLSRYVEKYFHDMAGHVGSLFDVVAPGGAIHYVVGNSKFYDVMLPAERIFASLFAAAGFTGAEVVPIRKRSSKKELFEFVVSARKPA